MRRASTDEHPAGRSRSRVGVVVVSVGFLALVVVSLMASPGAATRVQAGVGDSGVWVTSVGAAALGRVNTEIAELNLAVPLSSARSDVVQSGSQVIVVDHAAGTATRISPATARPDGSVALPPGADGLTIAGADALITSRGDGRVWSIPLDAFGGRDAQPGLVLDLGTGAVVTPTPTGGAIAVDPNTGELVRAEPGVSLAAGIRDRIELANDHGPLQLIATTSAWAALETTAALLATPAGEVDLSGFAEGDDPGGLVLQAVADEASDPAFDPAADDSVLVSSRSSLLDVDLATGTVTVVDSGHDGLPVRPVVAGGCIFAAWGDGTSWHRCADDPPAGVAGVLPGLAASDRPVFRTNSGRVVLNDSSSGRVWAPASGDRLIDNWSQLLPQTDTAGQPVSGTATVPIAIAPLWRRGPDVDSSPSRGGTSSVTPPAEVAAAPPPPPSPPLPPTSDAADQLPSRPPVPTPVTAVLHPETGTVSLSWAPFQTEADPVRGYFIQSLGPDGTAAESPCTLLPSGTVQAPVGGAVVDVAMWTSGSFDGIDVPAATYGFLVWGYNGAGCTAGDLVTVAPLAAPTAVTALDGSMVDVGTDYDYELRSATPAASLYEVQRLDAGGTPAGEVAQISLAGAAVIPRAVTGGQFGDVYSFRIRACNSPEEGAACGEWSDQAAPEASVTFALTDLSYSEETGIWSWSSLPDNGALPLKVRCGSDSDGSIQSTSSRLACWTGVALPVKDAWVRVFVGSQSRVVS